MHRRVTDIVAALNKHETTNITHHGVLIGHLISPETLDKLKSGHVSLPPPAADFDDEEMDRLMRKPHFIDDDPAPAPAETGDDFPPGSRSAAEPADPTPGPESEEDWDYETATGERRKFGMTDDERARSRKEIEQSEQRQQRLLKRDRGFPVD
jgi:hypothetical protein